MIGERDSRPQAGATRFNFDDAAYEAPVTCRQQVTGEQSNKIVQSARIQSECQRENAVGVRKGICHYCPVKS